VTQGDFSEKLSFFTISQPLLNSNRVLHLFSYEKRIFSIYSGNRRIDKKISYSRNIFFWIDTPFSTDFLHESACFPPVCHSLAAIV